MHTAISKLLWYSNLLLFITNMNYPVPEPPTIAIFFPAGTIKERSLNTGLPGT